MRRFFLLIIPVWFVACAAQPQPEEETEAVRGVWLTNVASDVLRSNANIEGAVELLDSMGFNSIFVVTWNRGFTLYPSAVMDTLTGQKIDPLYLDRDPLQEVIEAAHARNIKVFAWFEFGFASSYRENGGVLLNKHPEWAARDKHGAIAEKNGFEWMNGLHPEVQNFLLSLVLEVVENYEVDGIQGDDRLPAMPSNGGYSEFNRSLYANEHAGAQPPDYEKDYAWVQWRAQKLSEFAKLLFQKVKAADPDCIVSMAPSIFPWSEENYLQDWPTWVRQGYVDLVIPQLYRYDIDAYKKLLLEITSWQLAEEDLNKFYPGVLLQVDDYNPDQEFLEEMIRWNREFGIEGEVFFFYEGIKKFRDFWPEIYPERAAIPKFIDVNH